MAFVPRDRLTPPTPIFGGVRNVTEESGGWFQEAATSLLDRVIRFDAGDVLLNIHLERCVRLRTLHSDAINVNVWSYARIYRERFQVVEIDAAFIAFGWAVIGQIGQITQSGRTEWNKLKEHYLSVS